MKITLSYEELEEIVITHLQTELDLHKEFDLKFLVGDERTSNKTDVTPGCLSVLVITKKK